MKRVVVTGLGIVSSIGNNKEEVKASLLEGKSGVKFSQEYCDKKFRCHVYAPIEGLDLDARIDRKNRRFMGDGVAYNFVAMKEAIEDSGLQDDQISNERTGIVMGTGGGSFSNVQQTVDLFREKGPKRVGPYMVSRTMGSTNSAVLATAFKIKGVNYSISSACSTSAHCIGHGAELIQMGKQDIVFAGGGEEVHWTFTVMFDAMGALSSKYNDNPQKASRAYDADRDGFVISGGGGVLVLEELEHAKKRGAKIYGELVGYGATSDGYDMVAPSGEGAVRCMKLAMQGLEQPIDYINTHGTSTPAGDITELGGVKKVFGDNIPVITSTKSLSGHALGAAGVNEAVYSLIMMENDFIAASANIENLDEGAKDCNILLERKDNAGLNTIMSNSFGFGGTNASLVFSRYKS